MSLCFTCILRFNFGQRAGRIEEEIEMLQNKLKRIEEGSVFGGRRTKTARSQGKKVHITVEQERSRFIYAHTYIHCVNFCFLFSLFEQYAPAFSNNLSPLSM